MTYSLMRSLFSRGHERIFWERSPKNVYVVSDHQICTHSSDNQKQPRLLICKQNRCPMIKQPIEQTFGRFIIVTS